jgi:uncharacterized protein YjbJ (UPF0337 family)
MRSIAIVAAASLVLVPLMANAQTTTTNSSTSISSNLDTMWAKIKGSWTQSKGAIKEQWGKLTDDDLLQIQGRRDVLVGKIQTRYGISHEQAEAQVSGWEQKHQNM